MGSSADDIRNFAGSYVEMAKKRGESRVQIRAGDIVREMRLHNRTPSVCSALASDKFQRQYHVKLVEQEGPPSGQSTSTVFTYVLEDARKAAMDALDAFSGAGRKSYEAVGGAEAFHRAERETWGE